MASSDRVRKAAQAAARIFYPKDPALYMEGSIPLYVELVVRGIDGQLYLVPAEQGGWWRRRRYDGLAGDLAQVSPEKVEPILRLLGAEIEPGPTVPAASAKNGGAYAIT